MRTRLFLSSPGDPVKEVHRAVLLHEAVDMLDIQSGDTIVDATLGGAGHAQAIVEKVGRSGALIAFDADAEAIERGKSALQGIQTTTHFIHANFRDLAAELAKLGSTKVDGALFDLGWSSYQLQSGRGFSFLTDEPLSMAYNASSDLTAATIVNEWEEESLADIIYGWGEERYARRIAKAIVNAREARPIKTARELGEIVGGAVPAAYRRGRTHPATKTFQALRIAVNDELGALEQGLTQAWQALTPGGRIAVISFHSLEDRIVKQRFLAWEKNGEGKRITKKPSTASEKELQENPRARSAKLRAIEKL